MKGGAANQHRVARGVGCPKTWAMTALRAGPTLAALFIFSSVLLAAIFTLVKSCKSPSYTSLIAGNSDSHMML